MSLVICMDSLTSLVVRTICNQTAKCLLLHSPDPYMALLSYRATPLAWCASGLNPSELLMRRHLRTDVPQVKASLVPNWPHVEVFRAHDKRHKARQKRAYDQ